MHINVFFQWFQINDPVVISNTVFNITPIHNRTIPIDRTVTFCNLSVQFHSTEKSKIADWNKADDFLWSYHTFLVVNINYKKIIHKLIWRAEWKNMLHYIFLIFFIIWMKTSWGILSYGKAKMLFNLEDLRHYSSIFNINY